MCMLCIDCVAHWSRLCCCVCSPIAGVCKEASLSGPQGPRNRDYSFYIWSSAVLHDSNNISCLNTENYPFEGQNAVLRAIDNLVLLFE